MTSFLCLKSDAWWMQGRWPGRLHTGHVTLVADTQHWSSQWVVSRHLGHQPPGWTSSLHCQFSWPAWWHLQQYLIFATFLSLDMLLFLSDCLLLLCFGCLCSLSLSSSLLSDKVSMSMLSSPLLKLLSLFITFIAAAICSILLVLSSGSSSSLSMSLISMMLALKALYDSLSSFSVVSISSIIPSQSDSWKLV